MRRLALAGCIAVAAAALVASPAVAGEPAPEPKPVDTEAPKLTGTPAPGQTLTCSQGTWANDPTAYAYSWLRDGSAIAGQSASTYTVQSVDQGHSISCEVTASNSGGQYTIAGLPSGSYNVDFFYEEGGNYQPQYFKSGLSPETASPVSVTVANTTSGIDAALAPGGQIGGRVSAAAGGAALADIQVCAELETTGARLGGGCDTTNASGEYTIAGLPSGAYGLELYPFEGDYLQVDEKGVAVSAPGTTSGVDFALASGGQIAGKVTAESGGARLADIEVCVEYSCVASNEDGEYTVPGLPSGTYEVKFSRQFSGGNYLSQTRAGVVVTAPGSTALNVQLASGGQIEGTVKAPGGAPAAPGVVQVCAEGASDSCAYVEAGGVYTLRGLSGGSYIVQFYGSEGVNYASQYYEDKASRAEAKPVMVTTGATTHGIDAEMHTGAAITGQVTAAAGGAPVAGVEVCAEEASPFVGECSETDPAGDYEITGLPAGTFTVAVRPEAGGLFELFEAPNYLPATLEGIALAAGTTRSGVNAALASGGEISGVVTAASGGAALAKIVVCAEEPHAKPEIYRCARTDDGGGAAAAKSATLAVPAPDSAFTQAKPAMFNAKSGQLEFFLKLANSGTLSWQLYFKNADVGFADALGVGGVGGVGGGAVVASAVANAEAAGHHRCKRGFVKHRGRCVRTHLPFASGSKVVPAGIVEIKVHADAKAIRALKQGRTLHVSGSFKFQSALGGSAVTHSVSAVIHWPRRKHRR